jgi:hypothetical protein
LSYDEFKALVCELSQRDDLTTHGLLPVPTLRRECGPRLARADIDAFLVRLHGEGVIHLLSHVEFDSLPAAVQNEALRLPSGQELYWIRCL